MQPPAIQGVRRVFITNQQKSEGKKVNLSKKQNQSKISAHTYKLKEHAKNENSNSLVTSNDFKKLIRDYIFFGLVSNGFNAAFNLLHEKREILDFFADSLVRFEKIREPEIANFSLNFFSDTFPQNQKTKNFKFNFSKSERSSSPLPQRKTNLHSSLRNSFGAQQKIQNSSTSDLFTKNQEESATLERSEENLIFDTKDGIKIPFSLSQTQVSQFFLSNSLSLGEREMQEHPTPLASFFKKKKRKPANSSKEIYFK